VNQKSVRPTDESECKVQPDAETNLIIEEEKALGVKTRNDADRGRVAAHEMICDGVLDGEMMLTQIMGCTKPYDRRYSWA